jgi:phospholipase/carboxylesterase
VEEIVDVAPRAAARTPGGTVVFLHGRGQGPQTVEEVAAAFATARIVAPRGGVSLRRGTTWFENARIGVARPESVAQAEGRFLDWLEAELGPGCRPWLCGFSNGGAFAAHLLMRHPRCFAGAALLSAPLVLPPWAPGALSGKPVFYGRGARDAMVPRAMFEEAEAYLDGPSGAAVTRHVYDIAHEIDPGEVRDLSAWFAARTAVPDPA